MYVSDDNGWDMTKNPLHSTITTLTTIYFYLILMCISHDISMSLFPNSFPLHHHIFPLLTFYLQMTFPEKVYFTISSFSFLTYSRELYLVMDLLLLLLYSDKGYRDSPPIYEC